MACQCPPSNNRSCATQGGNLDAISLAQPTCVIVTQDVVESNPYFDMDSGRSYWAYKIVVGCNVSALLTPEDIYIPVYENIEAVNISIFERILSCGRFEEVTFNFTNPSGVTPPAGFRFIRIPIDGRYTRGVTAYYVIEVMGDFPESEQTLYVSDTDGVVQSFTDAFVVPGEPLNPRLTVTKTSNVVIDGNQATIEYTSTVTNTGNVDLTDIIYTDVINFDGANLSIGQVTVDPDTIAIDTTVNGIIRLSGDIGDLTMGETFTITTIVPITNFATPDTYTFASTTSAATGDVQNTINTSVSIEAVEFATLATCNTPTDSSGEFFVIVRSLVNSPTSDIRVITQLVVPNGVTVQFTSFNGCTARFEGSGDIVPLNTDVTESMIQVDCDIIVAPNGTVTSIFAFNVVSTTSIDGTLEVTSTIANIRLQTTDSQVFIGATPIPNTSIIEVGGSAICSDSCLN